MVQHSPRAVRRRLLHRIFRVVVQNVLMHTRGDESEPNQSHKVAQWPANVAVWRRVAGGVARLKAPCAAHSATFRATFPLRHRSGGLQPVAPAAPPSEARTESDMAIDTQKQIDLDLSLTDFVYPIEAQNCQHGERRTHGAVCGRVGRQVRASTVVLRSLLLCAAPVLETAA